jgi:histone acetyltransferase (RNA polymerase elongator complex component)
MTKIRSLRFPFPEPRQKGPVLLPVFLPFAGCPGRCVFCDQQAQTGTPAIDLEHALAELDERLARVRGPFALGFFGGTFTGLSPLWQERCLTLAGKYRGPDGLVHLRVSTRPDRIDRAVLERLRNGGVSMVELGVQTFDAGVLAESARGYDGQTAELACSMVREAGLELGIQLLPGLPRHDPRMWREDVDRTLALRPDVVRIYPCVVMAGTKLAERYTRGEYRPWPLDLAVAETAWALLRFWNQGVRVIRLGLAAEGDMLARLVAGPWHPAFGNMARAQALRLYLEERLEGARVARIVLPRRLSGDLWGHGRSQTPALARLGIVRDRVAFWSEPDIFVELEE